MMFKLFYFWLIAALLISQIAADSSSSDDDDDGDDSSDSKSKPKAKSMEKKKEKTKDIVLCDEPTPTTKCSCDLDEWFMQFKTTLTVTEQTTFTTLITMIHTDILVKPEITYMQKFTKVWYAMKKFKSEGADKDAIFMKFKDAKLGNDGGDDWFGFDLEMVSISLMSEIVDSTISLDATDNTKLFDAIKAAAMGDPASGAADAMIVKIKGFLKDTALSVEQQKVKISEEMTTFVEANGAFKQKFFEGEIMGFGKIEGFFDVVMKSKQWSTSNTVLDGDADANELVKALDLAHKDPAVPPTPPTIPECMRNNMELLFDMTRKSFKKEMDSKKRIKEFAYLFYQFAKNIPGLKPHLCKIKLPNWGNVCDLVYLSTIVVSEFEDITTECTTQPMDSLIVQPASSSFIIKALEESYAEWGSSKSYFFWNMTWSTSAWLTFKNPYKNDITATIDGAVTEKHKKISTTIETYTNMYTNKTWFSCIPIEGYGFMYQYVKCNNPAATTACPIPWTCIAQRHSILEIDTVTGKSKMDKDLEEVMKTFDATKKGILQPYFDDIKFTTSDTVTFKTKAHKMGRIVKIIQDLMVAQPTYKFVYDIHINGFGNFKKIVGCQGIKVNN